VHKTILYAAVVCLVTAAFGQSQSDVITAVPNRPTISSTAETVQTGVFEVEYGFEAAEGHQNINGLLKFGLTKNLELHFANNPFQRDDASPGMGDSGVGFKYRLFGQRAKSPTVSLLYMATMPTATHDVGLNSQAHFLSLLVSKDFGKHHFDFNEGVQFVGRSSASGFDHNYFTALAYSHPITGKWGWTGEVSSLSRLNNASPASVSLLAGPTYSVSPRLILDAGAYYSPTGNLPRVTFYGGVTYSLANLYR
jgi:hypothetical protein